MTSGLRSKTYEDRLLEVGMTSLENRRDRGDAIQTWKILTGYDNVQEKTWFDRCTDNSERDTRQSVNELNLRHKSFNYDFRKYSYSRRATRQWNFLPNELRESRTLREFKSRYDDIHK